MRARIILLAAAKQDKITTQLLGIRLFNTSGDQAEAMTDSSSQQSTTPQMVSKFATMARARMRIAGGGCRRDHLRARPASPGGAARHSQFRFEVADPARFELTTSAFGGRRSIQQSYGSGAWKIAGAPTALAAAVEFKEAIGNP